MMLFASAASPVEQFSLVMLSKSPTNFFIRENPRLFVSVLTKNREHPKKHNCFISTNWHFRVFFAYAFLPN